jgi:hypothetical protein
MALAIMTYGEQAYNYVASHDSRYAAEHQVVDFGVVDSKGRKVGMSRCATRNHLTLVEGEAPKFGRLLKVGAPLDYFEGRAISTRNGSMFGSAEIRVQAPTLDACLAELDKRIERARVAAVKKWSA